MHASRGLFCLTILLNIISLNTFCAAAEEPPPLAKLREKFAKAFSPKVSAHKIINAISAGDLDETRRLLDEKPARVNAQWQKTKWTPLIEATSCNFCDSRPLRLDRRLEFVQLLLDRGADVNAIDASGTWSALMMATNNSHEPSSMPLSVIELLITSGATINLQTGDMRFTPLMFAARNNREDIVTCLLANGADKTLQNKAHKTAADLAREEGHEELADLIEAY